MLVIPEIADNYCLEGSKIKISLKCFGMLCFALLCFGGKSFKTFSLKNLHQPLDQNEGFKLKTTYIKHAGGTGAKHLFINAAKLRFQSWYSNHVAWSTHIVLSCTSSRSPGCFAGAFSFTQLKRKCHCFYPELTLDHQTSLSSPAHTGPWFVSGTYVDPGVLHTNIWDHQVSCAEHLDSLHPDGTAI